MGSTEQRLDFNSPEDDDKPASIPPSVLKPEKQSHYEAMAMYLEKTSMGVIEFLVNTHGQSSPSRRLAEVWGIWLTLQQNILYHEAVQNGWDEEGKIKENVEDLIMGGLKRLSANFEHRQGMAEFLEEAKDLTLKGWEKEKTNFIKEIIVKKR